ncbi:hypothetical protein K470DRAFT_298869 [Piedraia hortae CBS 480.64]|uniref:5-nitroimidazole antibiotic resistance protein n=1 Tax=Piedraia hortae CBS 480.64 TaxID=1314780 RepID=A0A6A7C3I9_9PEZI|nr:hypothetical protein K470DRAFT_298869 [Piedraia hortae CBS 480.64]
MASYPVDPRSKGNRLAKRTKYDVQTIHSIVNECPILHVSFNSDESEFPTILPMLGAMGCLNGDGDEEGEEYLYLHGSSTARLFKLGSSIPLCISATILDGYVLAYTPFHNSCNYRSAILFGRAEMVGDNEERLRALRLITNNTVPNRWENSRGEMTNAEMTATAVLKVNIETASHKVRNGGPGDDKADLVNDELTTKTFVGVVPAYLTLADPVAAEYNKLKQVPEYLKDWVADTNSTNEQKAIDAMEEN